MSNSTTLDTVESLLLAASGVGAGVVGGVLFGFSTFVMSALDTLDPKESIRAMQAINVKAPNVWFMTAMFGTAAAAVAVGAIAASHLDRTGARWTIVGSVAYLASVAITAGYHVPKNDRLARLGPSVSDAARVWGDYSSSWTTGNHLRTALAVGAAACFTLALRAGAVDGTF